MKLFLPKQHGAWAMAIVPFWLGVVESGFVWQDIPFFLGWLLLYLATYPMLLLFKKKKLSFYLKWSAIYIIPAILLLLFPLFKNPSLINYGFIMLPFFAINAYFSSQNKDRALLNDFSAIFAFSIVGISTSYLVHNMVTSEAVLIFFTSVLFFAGCTFYVKTMIREKKNTQFKWVSWCYHILLPLVWLGIGFWIVALSFIPSLIRAIWFYGKPLSPKQIGIYEIINAALFFIIMVVQLVIN